MKYDAYWISPAGKSIGVKINHIGTVLNNPEIFELTKDFIVKKYKDYGEPIGLEGKARADVMLGLIKKGWMRARYYPKFDRWQLQTYDYGKREQDIVLNWGREALAEKYAGINSDLLIMIIKTQRTIKSSFLQIANGKKRT
jgi:hypothetical protein